MLDETWSGARYWKIDSFRVIAAVVVIVVVTVIVRDYSGHFRVFLQQIFFLFNPHITRGGKIIG